MRPRLKWQIFEWSLVGCSLHGTGLCVGWKRCSRQQSVWRLLAAAAAAAAVTEMFGHISTHIYIYFVVNDFCHLFLSESAQFLSPI